MKRFLIAAALATLVTAGAGMGVGQAKSSNAGGNPGPNGHNNHGLCTALFNGSDQGRANKQKAGPFAALIAQSPDGPSDSDSSGGSLSDAWDWCQQYGVGGNPTQPPAS